MTEATTIPTVVAETSILAVATTSTSSPVERKPDGGLGAAAVTQGLGVHLQNDVQFEQACADYAADPEGFAASAATQSRPIGGDEIQPIPADVHAWAEIAC